MQNCRLTTGMEDFLDNLFLSLILPMQTKDEHKSLIISIWKFHCMDFLDKDALEVELRRIFDALDIHLCDATKTGDEETSLIFAELKHALQILHRNKSIFEEIPARRTVSRQRRSACRSKARVEM